MVPYVVTIKGYSTTTVFYEPLGPFIVLLSAALFLFFRSGQGDLPVYVKQIRDFAGRYAYGIYLCHALILYLLDLFLHIDYKLCTPIISIPVTRIVMLRDLVRVNMAIE